MALPSSTLTVAHIACYLDARHTQAQAGGSLFSALKTTLSKLCTDSAVGLLVVGFRLASRTELCHARPGAIRDGWLSRPECFGGAAA